MGKHLADPWDDWDSTPVSTFLRGEYGWTEPADLSTLALPAPRRGNRPLTRRVPGAAWVATAGHRLDVPSPHGHWTPSDPAMLCRLLDGLRRLAT